MSRDWDSLDKEIDEGAEEAWREEIQRRLQEIDNGAAKLVQWDEARSCLYQGAEKNNLATDKPR